MRKDVLVIFILLFLVILFLHEIVFTTDKLVKGIDILTLNLPLKSFLKHSIANHITPLWNPYTYCGLPFITQVQPAIFYPLDIIFYIFPINIAMNICVWLHFFLAGVFTYLFTRVLNISRYGGLIASIIFIFNGYMLVHLISGHIPIIKTLPWIPVILLCLEKAFQTYKYFYALAGGILLSIQLFAGFPQITFYTVLCIICYSIFKMYILKTLRFLLPVVLITTGVLISAVQILPVLEIMPYTTKCSGSDFSYLFVSSFSPLNLITFIMPEIFGDGINVKYWGEWYFGEMIGYIGILPLIVMAVVIFFYRDNITILCTGIIILFLLIAFGSYLPYANILYLIPGFNIFRCSARALVITGLFCAILTGYSCSWIIQHPQRLKNIIKILICISICMVIFILWFSIHSNGLKLWIWIIKIITSLTTIREVTKPLSIEFIISAYHLAVYCMVKLIILVSLSTVLLYLWYRQYISCNIFKVATTGLILIDLWVFGYKYIDVDEYQDIPSDKEMITFLAKDTSYYRIIDSRCGNNGLRYMIQQADGFESSISKRYNQIVNICNNMDINMSLSLVRFYTWHNILNLLNVKYIIVPSNIQLKNISNLIKVFSGKYIDIYQNLSHLPRAFIVHEFEVLKPEDILTKLKEWSFNPRRCVLLEEYPATMQVSLPMHPHVEYVNIRKYSLNHVIMDVKLDTCGFVVLTDAWYPGWKVYIDGKLAKIYIADYIFRAVQVEKGTHNIMFIYSPDTLIYGLIITLSTIIILLLIITSMLCAKLYK